MQCPKCGRVINPKAKKCLRCGAGVWSKRRQIVPILACNSPRANHTTNVTARKRIHHDP